jgi:hypothetical protein
MGGYIGARAGSLSTTTVANVQDVTATDTTPEVTIINNTHEDTDGGREGKVIFKGQQSGGEESTLAEIQGSHDGTADDEKGDLIFKTNDGMRIDSAGQITLTGNIANTSGDFTLDVDGDIVLDANGAQLRFKDDGTEIGVISNSSNDLQIVSSVSDADMIFRGNDGGTPFNALTLDMSAAGDASFNRTVSAVNVQLDAYLTLKTTDDQANNWVIYTGTSDKLEFNYNGSGNAEVVIDNSGNFLVGKSSTSIVNAGSALLADGRANMSADNATALAIARQNNVGDMVDFYSDTTVVGTIGYIATGLFIDGEANHSGWRFGAGGIAPFKNGADTDNTTDVGTSAARLDDVHATNGTIQTSDENEKQNIASLTSAEITAATAISKLFKTFKWKDRVAEKGDNARTHTGVVAQQVEKAMSDAGLDAGNYSFFISSTWWEAKVEVAAVEADESKSIEAKAAYTRTENYDTKDAAPEGATERNRKGIRYPELLSFIGAATEQRLTSIESRLTALEG